MPFAAPADAQRITEVRMFSKFFDNERLSTITFAGITGIFAIGDTIRTGRYFDDGWIHPVLIFGVLATILAIGLYLRQDWSRWVGILLATLSGALVIWHIYLNGISIQRTISLTFAPALIWFF